MDKSISQGLDSADTASSMMERAPVPQDQMVPDLLKSFSSNLQRTSFN